MSLKEWATTYKKPEPKAKLEGHAAHAAKARRVLGAGMDLMTAGETMRGKPETRAIVANACATLAVYELLLERLPAAAVLSPDETQRKPTI